MLSAFKYRIYPSQEQDMRLNRSLLSLCHLYNDLKAEEMRRYREEHWSTSLTAFRTLTQFCHGCLQWVQKDLRDREQLCPNCSEVIPRDLNSALLIKRLGILRSPASDGGSSPAEQGPLPSLREMVSPSVEAGSLLLQG